LLAIRRSTGRISAAVKTREHLLTSEVLYQLSYVGVSPAKASPTALPHNAERPWEDRRNSEARDRVAEEDRSAASPVLPAKVPDGPGAQ
jgi:hypothetical protein